MNLRWNVLLLAGSLLLTGCKGPSGNNAAAVQSLKDNETRWNADYAAKDLAGVMAHYADDASLIVAGEKPVSGKDAIAAAMKAMLADPNFSLQIHPEKAFVSASGDLGFTEGTYALTITNPVDKKVVHDNGAYVTTYRKGADGTWKAVSDAPVSSIPGAPAQ